MTSVRDRVQVRAQHAHPGVPRRRLDWRVVTFAAVLVVYLALSVAVVHRTWVLQLDADIYNLHIRRDVLSESQYEALYWYVTLGQRGPATLAFLPYFIWTAYRTRSARPLVMLGVALLLLNLSVGAMKLATGRIGPRYQSDVFNVFNGGDIYPSGHVSNAVVLYGLIAMISLRHRRLFTVAAVWIAVTVGLGTIAINTHWASDVVGGWFAGSLVLLALPWFVPTAERILARVRRGFTATRVGHRITRHLVRRREAIDRVLPPPPVPVNRSRAGGNAIKHARSHRRTVGARPRPLTTATGRAPRGPAEPASAERDPGQLDRTLP